ncbi:14 kDa proline-rich protein DC2.15-like [Tripterygium wilfordii]|uniref:14 kDa proline-rich protein DC2.15-like n=1 Tax=Tripterygium wilfordii TaxID=458696 RepID=A0A7J7CKN2_TRIWF|nr:putative lipid-binding protein AIR1B [Tripterygium wilfordii]KAF5734623.1 14 kDa proline-rich protein DC2.15-like [Tripterygium wilfordii]
MGSKGAATTTLLVLVLNLVLINCVSSSYVPSVGTCPNGLKLDLCANVLGGLLKIRLGSTDPRQCCPLIAGLADLDAAACLCLSLNDLNILGLPLLSLIPNVSLNLLLNQCGYGPAPSSFQCAYY